MDRGEIPMERRWGESHHEAHDNPAAQGDPHGQRRDPHGAQKKRVHHGAQQNISQQPRQRQKSCKYSSTSLYNMDRTAGNQGNEQCSNTNWLLSRPFGRNQWISAHWLISRPFTSSSWQFGGIRTFMHIDSFQDLSYPATADSSEEFTK